MSQRAPCAFCGSQNFEEENGVIVCESCGRQQEGGLQVADDDADFGTQGKIVRKKVEKKKVKTTRIYRGKQAYRLYLQVWQHILWRQVHALIHSPAKVPSRLWTVTRDLWTLKLAKIAHGLADLDIDKENDLNHDPSSGEEMIEAEKSKPGLSPKLSDTVSVIYAAALLIHWPLTIFTIYKWVMTEEIPYVRAIRHVPFEMSSRLPSEYQLALDTIKIPTVAEIKQGIFRTLSAYHNDHGMTLPAMNWRLVLFQWINDLGLPIEVYPMVKQLGAVLQYNYTYQIPMTSDQYNSGSKRTKSRRSPVAMAETQLIVLLIIATKLLFPPIVNGLPDQPQSQSGLLIDWSTWLHIHMSHSEARKHQQTSVITAGKHIEVKDRDILTMTPEQLDSYMDWYQRTFAMSEAAIQSKKTDLERSILDMFPLPEPTVAQADRREDSDIQNQQDHTLVAQVQREAMLPAPITSMQTDVEDEENDEGHGYSKVGSQYPIFPDIASLTSIPILQTKEDERVMSEVKAMRFLHEKAAELASLDLKHLLKAVRHAEGKLEKWITERKRDSMFPATHE